MALAEEGGKDAAVGFLRDQRLRLRPVRLAGEVLEDLVLLLALLGGGCLRARASARFSASCLARSAWASFALSSSLWRWSASSFSRSSLSLRCFACKASCFCRRASFSFASCSFFCCARRRRSASLISGFNAVACSSSPASSFATSVRSSYLIGRLASAANESLAP